MRNPLFIYTNRAPEMNTSNAHQYVEGENIPFHLNPGVVVGSFFVSLVGTITTVELLHRRTTWKGWYSRVYLGACSVSMGLIGIWCMHFIGNTSIIMGHNEPDLQLVYNRGYIAASAFIPSVALFVGFTVADMRSRGQKYLLAALTLAGIICGLAILGMHYSANAGISNYKVHYIRGTIGAAMVIACLSSIFALALFFLLQELWINFLLWRLVCAVVLAGAVCGMHFEAAMGTRYQLIKRGPANVTSRNTNVIVATVLCVLTVPVCAFIAISQSRRRKHLADRAQMVVLASATFDDDGRVLVTQQGLLPCRKITKQHNERAFEDQFDVKHPAFQWIYRVTHNWSGVIELIPAMRQHLRTVNHLKEDIRPGSADSTRSREEHSADQDYSFIFREGFCVAAADLAGDLHEAVGTLGTLYDDIMMTGTIAASKVPRRRFHEYRFSNTSSLSCFDEEAGTVDEDLYGKGQLLFVTRRVEKQDAMRLISSGFRFASMDKIGDIVARSMQVPTSYLTSGLLRVWACANRQLVPSHPNTYLACFALRPGVVKKGFGVAVLKAAPHLLPHVDMSDGLIEDWKLILLSRFDGWSVKSCLAWLSTIRDSLDSNQRDFYHSFKASILQLGEQVDEPFFENAIFSSKLTKLPRYSQSQSGIDGECNLLVFHIVPDVHSLPFKPTSQLTYTPLSFYKSRQQVLDGAPDHANFARSIHQEFASIIPQKSPTSATLEAHATVDKKSPKRWSAPFRALRSPRPSMSRRSSTGGARPRTMPEIRSRSISPTPTLQHGGVLVQRDFTVDIETTVGGDDRVSPGSSRTGSHGSAGEILGTSARARPAEADGCGFVDELFAVATKRWTKC